MTFEGNTPNPKIVIAIDGFSSSGKSTMARALARRLGYRYIDSGAMYRAVTLYALRHGIIGNQEAIIKSLPDINIDFSINADGSQSTILNGENVEKEIRSMEVSSNVSQLATIPEVRRAMVLCQQAFGQEKGIVMDGRDITTVVFPDAELKIFVNASAETRAKRRFAELMQKGDSSTTYEDVLDNIRKRDWIDTHRADSPMYVAQGAVELDNSEMTLEQQNEWLDNLVARRIKEIKDESEN